MFAKEIVEKQFTELLGRLKFDDEVLEWVREALDASHADQTREHEDAMKRLGPRLYRLPAPLKCYVGTSLTEG